MVASLKRVYENVWTLQKNVKKAAKAQNRSLAVHLHNQVPFSQF